MKKHRLNIVLMTVFILLVLVACSPSEPSPTPLPTEPPLPTPTYTPLPTDTPVHTPTPLRTPPALPGIYQPAYLDPGVTPHIYINDACQYLKMKWDPNNSEPGTVVMVIMFHAIINGGVTEGNAISKRDFNKMMDTLKKQGYEAINTEQLANFLESNAKIPSRSVLLLVDDRHFSQYFNNHFRPYWEDWGWPVVNAWISDDETPESWWEENEALNAEGWVDYQAHGFKHNYGINIMSDEAFVLRELQEPIVAFQQHFNKTPIAFIWPGGNFTPRAVQLARETGYRLGFTVNGRGPIMFNWVPLADAYDPNRPTVLEEGPVGDPLMVLPRYWPINVNQNFDKIRVMSREAAAHAEANKAVELEFYDIVCAPAYGPIPSLAP
jgi:peptidoglycan/xylan/chitin deacetylase (PgdA/CDA1 family)